MKLMEKIKNGVYMIAEMSANHAGSLDTALEIVRAAKEAGADCLKIQTYTADSMTLDCDNEYFRIEGGLWDGYKLYDLYKEASTPYGWQKLIKEECGRLGMDFLSTPFDAHAVDFLEGIGVEAYKIASFELTHIPLIKYAAGKGKPMIVSCGMGSAEEIGAAVDAMAAAGLPKEKIVLLKCTSEYPAVFEDMNLSVIPDMAKRFGTVVGLSDHSMGHLAPVVAVALGARVIEKHFTVSRDIKNPDSEFSMEPSEFAEMVGAVKTACEVLGNGGYGLTEKEKESLKFRRSIFAAADIGKSEEFTQGNIKVIRPSYGAAPICYDELLGKESKRGYRFGEPILVDEVK
ncbi:MAG: pseudaminic acid synthase [Clostridiales Family XIII bacterium]|jgi:pseudaminic acid synthase|nr:pseudaminic acid synthase [Clostridiales Family XIII bacterium]